jgi:hypothetical protein
MHRLWRRGILDLLLVLLSALCVLGACQSTPELTSTPVGEVTSPVQSMVTTSPLNSPVEPARVFESFSIDEPLLVGATQVTGRGPAGLEIVIVDVTLSAQHLGYGRVEYDGRFAIDVSPLPEAHAIGVMLNEPLEGELQENVQDLWGPGGIDLPMLGSVFASVMTTKP